MSHIDYKKAGVDIQKGEQLVREIKTAVENTFCPQVLSPLGGFASLYDLSDLFKTYQNPVMVQSIDGVGTKSIVARMAGDFSHIGDDLVSAVCNDIIVIGAKPVTFLDYIANDKLSLTISNQIICSIANACKENDIALVGGETAEMPDTYKQNENDIVGVVTGFVDKTSIVNGQAIKPGNIILGLSASGLHTNGYSLARQLFFNHLKLNIDSYVDELSQSVAEALLTPHTNYCKAILNLLQQHTINGMAHITGGGIKGNLSRILPYNCNAEIKTMSIPSLPLYSFMQNTKAISLEEMYHSFNMGVGYVLVVEEKAAESVWQTLNQYPTFNCFFLGQIVNGQQEVNLL